MINVILWGIALLANLWSVVFVFVPRLIKHPGTKEWALFGVVNGLMLVSAMMSGVALARLWG